MLATISFRISSRMNFRPWGEISGSVAISVPRPGAAVGAHVAPHHPGDLVDVALDFGHHVARALRPVDLDVPVVVGIAPGAAKDGSEVPRSEAPRRGAAATAVPAESSHH